MHTETVRKLDLIVRIEETLAEVVYDAVERIEDSELREHLRDMAEHHDRHATELLNLGITPSASVKVDIEMDTYRRRIENRTDERELLEALYNMEREQSARIEESLTEHLEDELCSALETAREEIEDDVQPIHEYSHGDGARLK
jgi:hypothetical protein